MSKNFVTTGAKSLEAGWNPRISNTKQIYEHSLGNLDTQELYQVQVLPYVVTVLSQLEVVVANCRVSGY